MFGRLKNYFKRPQKHKSPATIDDLAQLLGRSGLITIRQAGNWLNRFRAEQPSESKALNAIDEFCRFLISNKCVSEWQCEKLKRGKWKGFYFEDRYVILEQVGKGGSDILTYYSAYKARDERTNIIVCLFIRPLRYSGGHFDYRVYPYM
jgi:hypothetical protein